MSAQVPTESVSITMPTWPNAVKWATLEAASPST